MTIDVQALRENLCHTFCRDVGVATRDSRTVTVTLPMTGRDGDSIMAYVTEADAGWRISDMGSTLMRLSYEHDLSKLLSGARERLYQAVLNESGLAEDDGELFVEVPADALPMGLFTLGQGITRIEDLGLWTRPRVESAFYEDLSEIIASVVPAQNRVEGYVVPNVPNGENYPVDYFIKTAGRPLYLFGVLNRDKARLTTIILQHLSKHAPSFESMVVYADMDDVPKPDSKRLITAANDVVPSIADRDAIVQKIQHRLAA